ncbi:VWA domain-containing protein [Moraxella canis]|nr:VWA domain-containing protein [Moraxella canis]
MVKGIPDTQGSQDTTNDTTAAGQIVLMDLQNIDPSELSIKLSGPKGIQVQGKDVVWHWSDQSNTLTGRVSLGDNQPETDVMTIKVNDIQNSGTGFTASYQTTLLHAIDHPQQNIEDDLDVKFNLQVTQGAKPLLQSDLIVTVEDNSPFVDSGDIFLAIRPAAYNLSIILDISGSMLEWVGYRNRLDVAKDAINKLIETYTTMGDVRAQVTLFDEEAST